MRRTRSQAVVLDKTNVILAKANTLPHKVSRVPASNENDSFQKTNLRRNISKQNYSQKKINKVKCLANDVDKENTKIPLSTDFLKNRRKKKLQNSNKITNTKIDSYFQKKSKDESDMNMPQKSIPVWKRLANNNNAPASKQMKMIQEKDIYDILQDEQLMTEKAVKKKVTRVPSKIPLKRKRTESVRKEKLSVQNKRRKDVSKRKCLSSVENKIMNIQTNSENKCKPETVKSSDARQSECQKQLNKKYTETDHSVDDKYEKEPKNFEKVYDQTFLEQEMQDVTICNSAPQTAGNVANEQCYSSFEKSILPQMTSTPDSKDRCCNNVQSITKLSEISSIMCPKSPCIIGDLLPTPESLPELTVSDTEINDITEDEIVLFESPTKEEPKLRNEMQLHKAGVLVNLFPEDPCLSPIKENLEESVLKPKKSYDTPKQFRKHIIRTKKAGQQKKKTAAQLREEKLIEEMNKHFSEVESFEFCVE